MQRYYLPTTRGRRVGHSYSTAFPLTENPISEGGTWLSGRRVTGAWEDVRTTPGLAFANGVQASPPFNDAIAILNGSWGADQRAGGHCRTVNQQAGFNQEVSFHLREAFGSKTTATGPVGYEILFKCFNNSNWYTDIVRWNGPVDDFDILIHTTSGPGLSDKDYLEAVMIGPVIKAYVNRVLVNTWDTTSDSAPVSGAGPARYLSGAPGMGMFQHGQTTTTLPDFGFYDFDANEL